MHIVDYKFQDKFRQAALVTIIYPTQLDFISTDSVEAIEKAVTDINTKEGTSLKYELFVTGEPLLLVREEDTNKAHIQIYCIKS